MLKTLLDKTCGSLGKINYLCSRMYHESIIVNVKD